MPQIRRITPPTGPHVDVAALLPLVPAHLSKALSDGGNARQDLVAYLNLVNQACPSGILLAPNGALKLLPGRDVIAQLVLTAQPKHSVKSQIGRASCRERV